jgi:hypothetical protein
VQVSKRECFQSALPSFIELVSIGGAIDARMLRR